MITGKMPTYKRIYLFACTEEGFTINWTLRTSKQGGLGIEMMGKDNQRLHYKEKLRKTDRSWCNRNIPSSIMWKTQVHHDWKNGGIMYLLSLKEHKERDKMIEKRGG